MCFFTKYTLFAEKNVFIGKKRFFTEKNKNENVKNIYFSLEIYFYTENVCVIDSAKKNFLIIKKYLLKRRCELNNLLLKVPETFSLWYSLNQLFPKNINKLLEKIYEDIYS